MINSEYNNLTPTSLCLIVGIYIYYLQSNLAQSCSLIINKRVTMDYSIYASENAQCKKVCSLNNLNQVFTTVVNTTWNYLQRDKNKKISMQTCSVWVSKPK